MPVNYRKSSDMVILTGQTYPFRDVIKSLGGRFNQDDKSWMIPQSPANIAAVERLSRSTGGSCLNGEQSLNREPVHESRDPTTRAVSNIDSLLHSAGNLSTPVPARSGPPGAALIAEALKSHEETKQANRSLTVSQVMELADGSIKKAFPQAVWVSGELQNINHKGNAVFFRLVEGRDGTMASAALSGTIWANSLRRILAKSSQESGSAGRSAGRENRSSDLSHWFAEGMEVRLYCQVQFYRDRGQVSLNVLDIDSSFSEGQLALKRQQTLKKLRAAGIAERNRSLTLPTLPLRIGLITAKDSRAASDFLHQLEGGGFFGKVIALYVNMQGMQTPEQVIAALSTLEQAGCELIVLTRGGGSQADLRWFDDEGIGRAVCLAKVPVLSAIGHHDDVSVAEELSRLHAKTPTAAAEQILSFHRQFAERFATVQKELGSISSRSLERQTLKLREAEHKLVQSIQLSTERQAHLLAAREQQIAALVERSLLHAAAYEERLQEALQRETLRQITRQDQIAERLTESLERSALRSLQELETKADSLSFQLQNHDPRPWLERGWTQLIHERGRVLRAADVSPGDLVRARLSDGVLTLTVMESRKAEEG